MHSAKKTGTGLGETKIHYHEDMTQGEAKKMFLEIAFVEKSWIS